MRLRRPVDPQILLMPFTIHIGLSRRLVLQIGRQLRHRAILPCFGSTTEFRSGRVAFASECYRTALQQLTLELERGVEPRTPSLRETARQGPQKRKTPLITEAFASLAHETGNSKAQHAGTKRISIGYLLDHSRRANTPGNSARRYSLTLGRRPSARAASPSSIAQVERSSVTPRVSKGSDSVPTGRRPRVIELGFRTRSVRLARPRMD
jgi:hypothetical protein